MGDKAERTPEQRAALELASGSLWDHRHFVEDMGSFMGLPSKQREFAEKFAHEVCGDCVDKLGKDDAEAAS